MLHIPDDDVLECRSSDCVGLEADNAAVGGGDNSHAASGNVAVCVCVCVCVREKGKMPCMQVCARVFIERWKRKEGKKREGVWCRFFIARQIKKMQEKKKTKIKRVRERVCVCLLKRVKKKKKEKEGRRKRKEGRKNIQMPQIMKSNRSKQHHSCHRVSASGTQLNM